MFTTVRRAVTGFAVLASAVAGFTALAPAANAAPDAPEHLLRRLRPTAWWSSR